MSSRGRPHLTGDDRQRLRERAVDLYTSGHTIDQVAHEIGRSSTTTRKLLIEARVTLRRPGTYDRQRVTS